MYIYACVCLSLYVCGRATLFEISVECTNCVLEGKAFLCFTSFAVLKDLFIFLLFFSFFLLS